MGDINKNQLVSTSKGFGFYQKTLHGIGDNSYLVELLNGETVSTDNIEVLNHQDVLDLGKVYGWSWNSQYECFEHLSNLYVIMEGYNIVLPPSLQLKHFKEAPKMQKDAILFATLLNYSK